MTKVELILKKPASGFIINQLLLEIDAVVTEKTNPNNILIFSEKPREKISKLIKYYMDNFEQPLSYSFL